MECFGIAEHSAKDGIAPGLMDTSTPYITALSEVVMGRKYTTEFKVEAARQVLDHGRPVRDVATRLRVSIDLLYPWVRE